MGKHKTMAINSLLTKLSSISKVMQKFIMKFKRVYNNNNNNDDSIITATAKCTQYIKRSLDKSCFNGGGDGSLCTVAYCNCGGHQIINLFVASLRMPKRTKQDLTYQRASVSVF